MSRTRETAVFLVGEGPHDIGDLAEHETYRRGREGFLQPMVRKLVGGEAQFDGRKIALLPQVRIESPSSAVQRRAAQALALAGSREADLLVFIADLDRTGGEPPTATERRRRWKERRDDIEAGFASVRRKTPSLAKTKAVAAIPCRMIEAWALGDSKAVESVAGGRLGCSWKNPENLWGNEQNASSEHPKCVLDRALQRKHSREDLAAIAEKARVETLSRECPLSFAPFREAMRDDPRGGRAGET